MCGKMCGKIEKMLDQNKIWCGTRYETCDYDSGDKKTKRQKGKKTKMQKDNKTKRQKDKKAKRQIFCNTLKIFADLSKHLPVFLLGTENCPGWVCGNIGSGLW